MILLIPVEAISFESISCKSVWFDVLSNIQPNLTKLRDFSFYSLLFVLALSPKISSESFYQQRRIHDKYLLGFGRNREQSDDSDRNTTSRAIQIAEEKYEDSWWFK